MFPHGQKLLMPEFKLQRENNSYYIVSGSKRVKNIDGTYHIEISCMYYDAWYVYIPPSNIITNMDILSPSTYDTLHHVKYFSPYEYYKVRAIDFECMMKNDLKLSRLFLKTCLFSNTHEYKFTCPLTHPLTNGFIVGLQHKLVKNIRSQKAVSVSDYKVYANVSLDFLYLQDKLTAELSRMYTRNSYTSNFLTVFLKQTRKIIRASNANNVRYENDLTYTQAIRSYYMYIFHFCNMNEIDTDNLYSFKLSLIISNVSQLKYIVKTKWFNPFKSSTGLNSRRSLDTYPMLAYKILLNAVTSPYLLYMYDYEFICSIYERMHRIFTTNELFIYNLLRDVYINTCGKLVSYIDLTGVSKFTGIIPNGLMSNLHIAAYHKCYIPLLGYTKTKVFLKDVLNVERYIYKWLLNKNIQTSPQLNFELLKIVKPLDKVQKKIVKRIINSKKHQVVLGQAGTGKSYLISLIASIYIMNNWNVVLTSPSGCATAVLNKAIAKLLSKPGVNIPLAKREDLLKIGIINGIVGMSSITGSSKKSSTVFVVDEVSMVNVYLFAKFIKILPEKSKIIFVGDTNQLRSIDGDSIPNFIKYLIDKGEPLHVNINNLTRIYRSKDKSRITNLSTYITSVMESKSTVDAFFDKDHFNVDNTVKLNTNVDIDTIVISIVNIYKQIRKIYKGKDPKSIITARSLTSVITPYVRSVSILNEKIQRNMKLIDRVKDGDSIDNVYQKFYLYDSVRMVTSATIGTGKNAVYVTNGLRGSIVEIDSKSIKVLFEDGIERTIYKTYLYGELNLGHISLSYATTIHNSQGSQYNTVLVYIDKYNDTHSFEGDDGKKYNTFMNINMLYVALTRASKNLFVYSNAMILNTILNTRNTRPVFMSRNTNEIDKLIYQSKIPVAKKYINKMSNYNPYPIVFSSLFNLDSLNPYGSDKKRKRAVKTARRELLSIFETYSTAVTEEELNEVDSDDDLDAMSEDEIY